MTVEQFIDNIQDYYDENYDEKFLPFIVGYLRKDHTERDLPKLIRYVMKVHARNWGLPDIHAFDAAWSRRNDDRKWETTEMSSMIDYEDPRENPENVRKVNEILESAKWKALKEKQP